MDTQGRYPERRSAQRARVDATGAGGAHARQQGANARARRQGTDSRPRQRSAGSQAQRRSSTVQRPQQGGSSRRPATQRDIYVGAHAPRRRFPWPLAVAVVAVIALVAVLAIAKPFSAPSTGEGAAGDGVNEGEQPAAVSDVVAEPVTFTVSFAGDCTLGTDEAFDYSTSLNARYETEGDPAYFFRNVADIFSADDLTVVNMEGTLTESTARQDKTFAFKGPADYAQVLVEGDVEAASLANNHSQDYGEQSYTDTIDALEAAGIKHFGYDDIAYLDVKGVKVALVGTYELAEHEGIEESMVANIQRARDEGAQVVLVYIHWGVEREYVPNDVQMQLGHAAIDAGADLVIGSHPHVIQGYEVYQGRYIVYSLGNFCFGGNSGPSDMDCMIFQQTFTVVDGQVQTDGAVNVIPCSISSASSYNNYQPTPAEGDEADRIMAKIEESSDAIAEMAAQMTPSETEGESGDSADQAAAEQASGQSTEG